MVPLYDGLTRYTRINHNSMLGTNHYVRCDRDIISRPTMAIEMLLNLNNIITILTISQASLKA